MNKKTLISIGVFAVLGIGAIVATRAPDKGERIGAAPGPKGVAAMKADAIDELEVTSDKQKTTIKKEGSGWMVSAPVHYPAEADAIKAALDKLGELAWGQMVSEQKERAKEMEVDEEKGA